MWKTMAGTDPSALPVGDNNEEVKSTEEKLPIKQRNKSQIILAQKFRNLKEFANAYNLNLSNSDDTLLKTDTAHQNIQQMPNDILSSIDKTNQMNLGSLVAQTSGNNQRLVTRSRMETLYQELLDVMPPKWKEVFQQQSK